MPTAAQTQEFESLTGVVRELTADRARAAAGRLALQQRCGALLADVARLGRVADVARRGQADSRAAAEAATTAKLEVSLLVCWIHSHKAFGVGRSSASAAAGAIKRPDC